MRVFLDTNVLVSAFATRGICADLFRHVPAEHDWLGSEHVLAELARVLQAKFAVPAALVAQTTAFARDRAECIAGAAPLEVEVRDPDDAPVLAAAVAGKADVLITGDRDLLVLGTIGQVRILDVRAFWESLTGAT